MDKDQLIYYVESLGFKKTSKYSFDGKEYYLFDGREDVVVEIHQVLDYYLQLVYWRFH